jgi:Rieske Fe-S protein
MQCTHQGAELSAHGEILVCPSHGSEFDRQGQVLSGPAEQNLKKFKLTTDENYLYIHLA